MKKIILILVAIILSSSFAYSQCNTKPTINSFAPNTGFIGSTVTIFGANFDANTISNNKVFFGATQATVQSANFGQLVVTVPVGASTARISVTNQCKLTAYSKAPFNGIFCPTPLDNSTYQNSAQNLSITYGAYNMIAVDLDLDGKPEVLSGGQSGGVSVAKNNSTPGNISFQALNFSQFGASSIYTADFDGDGLQDIVSRNIALLNTSTGPGNINFGPAISTNSVSSYQVAAGDFNNDGKIDIVGEDGSVIYIAKNNSTGPGNLSFSARQSIENVGTRCTGIMVADVDGDGKQDILATQGNLDRAVTLRNTTPDGSSTFTFEPFEAWPTNGDYPYRCQIADFNKDGKMDLTTCNFSSTANTAIFINTSTPGDISFATTINLPAPNSNYRIQVGDVDGDGYPDIVTKSTAQNVFSVYKNTTTNVNNTSFAARIDYSSSAAAEVSGIVVGDLDGDFVPDIATSGTSSRQIRIHRNTSSQQDNTPPTAICKNINVGLNPSGSVTITPSQVDNGSSDACGIDNISLSQTTFTCADIGNNVVTLIVTDLAGNTDTCSAIVNVQPAAIIVAGQTTVCAGQTISISANPGDSYQWKVDGVAIAGATSQTFTASQSGSYTVVVTNAGGCSGESVPTTLTISTGSNVSVTPTNATITCGSPTTLTAGNAATYQWKFNGTNIAGATISTYAATQAGQYSVDVIDIFGCPGTSNTVNLVVGPPIAYAKDTTLYLDAGGNISLNVADIDDGTVANCPNGTVIISPSNFTCSNIGANNATLIVSDGNGNSDTAFATVTVLDTLSPILNITSPTIYLDSSGVANLTAQDVDNGTSDNCSLSSLSISQSTFGCADKGVGSISQAVPITYVEQRNFSDQQYHGFAYDPINDQFISPQWAGTQLKLNDYTTLNSLGSLTSPKDQIMGMWVDPSDGDYYVARWSYNEINRISGNTVVWSVNVGSTAASITTDDNYVYSLIHNGTSIEVFNKSNGSYVKSISIPFNSYSYGGLVLANNQFYIGGYATANTTLNNTYNAIHVLDIDGNYISSTSTVYPTYYGIAFDGENLWFGNGSSLIYKYKIANGNSFSGSGGTAVAFTAVDGSGNSITDTTYISILDTLAPVVQTNNVTVYLDASGNATVTLNDIDNGITDNCAIDSISLSGNTSYDCSHIGGNTVSITATDSSANSTSVNATVTVIDSTKPTILVNNITVTLDANLQATISINDIDAGSSDNCTLNNLALGQTTFDCNDKGQTIAVTLTGTDQSGNTASAVAQVTVTDPSSHCNQPPTAVCQNITIYTGSTCDASITANNVDGGSTDPDGDALTYSVNQSGPFGVGTYTVTLTVDDGEYTDACTAVVTVVDSTSPAALCQDVTVTLDANGQGTILGQPTTNTVFNEQFQADANAGNSATLTNWNVLAGNVDVNDFTTGVGREIDMSGNTNATIETKSTINLQPGTYEFSFHHLTNSNPNPNNSLNIQIGSLLNETFPAPSSVQQVTRTLTVTSPISVTIRMQEVGPNDNAGTFIGNITLTEIVPGALAINNGSSDACGVGTITASQTTFTCADVGTNTVTLTVTDVNGNSSSCNATVTVLDTTPAVYSYPSDITAYAVNTCSAGIQYSNPSGSDNCKTIDSELTSGLSSGSNFPVGITTNTFDVTTTFESVVYDFEGLNAGTTLHGQDNWSVVGNTSTNGARVDSYTSSGSYNGNNALNIVPLGGNNRLWSTRKNDLSFAIPVPSSNQIIELTFDHNRNYWGSFLGFGSDLNNDGNISNNEITFGLMEADIYGSVELFGPGRTNKSTYSYAASGWTQWKIKIDPSANGGQGSASVSYRDLSSNGTFVSPSSLQNVNMGFSSSATNNLNPSNINGMVYFHEAGESSQLDNINYTLHDVSTFSFNVTVLDTIPPTAICKNATVVLDANGNGSITTADIDDGSTDVCGIASLALDNSSFSCADVGANTVTLTVTDNNGNSSTCTSTVTVIDNEDPIIVGNNNNLNMDFNGGSGAPVSYTEDGITFLSLYGSSSHVHLGDNDGDGSGDILNHANCCSTPYRLTVGAGTEFTLISMNVKRVSGNPTFSVHPSGPSVTITSTGIFTFPASFVDATEIRWNQNVGTMVIDDVVVSTKTTGSCPADIVVNTDAGSCGAIVNYASNVLDNCSASIAFSPASGSFFNLGTTTVTTTATDASGNTSSCTFDVTVNDNEAPVTLTQDITVQLDASGNASIGTGDIDNGSNDACGIASLALDNTSFTCANVGANTVTLTSTDVNGNSSSATATVTVEDNVNPITLTQDITVQLDASGNASIGTGDIDNGSNDACGIASLALDNTSFTCADVGANTVTLTSTDVNGNSSSATATVTVEDNVNPVTLTQDITVYLDHTGNVNITPSMIDDGSNDACGIDSLSLDQDSFDCSEVGSNTVNLTAWDVNNNSSTTAATVTVLDTTIPIISGCPSDITVSNLTGNCFQNVMWIAPTASDNCSVASIAESNNGGVLILPLGNGIKFGSFPVGSTEVKYTVTDANGNVSICTFNVVVEDTEDPYLYGVPADITVNNDAGSCDAYVTWTPPTVSDNCPNVMLYANHNPGETFPVGVTTVVYNLMDPAGNAVSDSFNIIVIDNELPTAISQSATIYLDAQGQASITTAMINNGSADNCGIDTVYLSAYDFTCNEVGTNNVTLTVEDIHGNVNTSVSSVTVIDNIAPIALTQDITVQLDASGNVSITAQDVDNGSNDACGVSLSVSPSSFTCNEVGANTVTLTVTDVNNNISTATATVTVEDNVNPVTLTQDITVQLDASGNASIGTGDIDNGSNDACGIASLALDNTSFTCADVGTNTVTLTSTDVNGNSSSATATVTVEDNVNPVTLTQDITVQLDASGNASIGTGDIDNGSNDACGIASLALDNTSFTCADVGTNTVTLTSTDVNGNSSSATATVTVEDNVNPVTLTQDITVQLDASGNASIGTGDIDNGSNDACGIASLALDNTSFTCADVGTNTVTLTSTDVNGNSSSATATVTVEDNVNPVTLTQDITVQLDASGNASIGTGDIDNGSNDACGIASLALDNTSFTCADVGANTVTLTSTDVNGNSSSATATVTVEDNVNPVTLTQDITVQLDASGNASIGTGDIDNGSNDACGIASLALDNTSFTCADVGANTVTLTSTDVNGNSSSATATVTVEDNVNPVTLTQDITVQLDASGNASIGTGDIDNGSNDACGIASLALDNTSFTCADVGANTVTLTSTDVNGNSSSATATVTVEDNVNPVTLTQDITVQLDASGNASIGTGDIDNGSNDACGIASLALDNTSFTCADVGANTVTLTSTDVNGNSSSATATVTVEDNVNPVTLTQDITVQLDASGNASIGTGDIDNGSNDACGIASLALDITSFTCADVGANTVTLTSTDVNGNSSSATATVTVEDNVAPIALTQNITVQLDASGQVSITAQAVDNGSNDACGVSLAVSPSSFTCNEVGANTVTLTVTDANNNVSTATATVTVEDNVAPIALTQDITVQLDASGNASITAQDVDNGSNDACGVSLAVSPLSFTCNEVGANTVTLTVTDANNNVSTATATVTVEDNVAPIALTQDITVQLDASGQVEIFPNDIDNGSNDACGVSLAVSPSSFTCNEVGANTVILTVTDANNNVSTATATVTVEDNVAPDVFCINITASLNASGIAIISAADIDGGTTDACGIASLTIDNNVFNCADVGNNSVTLTATDVNGNVSTCVANVYVEDPTLQLTMNNCGEDITLSCENATDTVWFDVPTARTISNYCGISCSAADTLSCTVSGHSNGSGHYAHTTSGCGSTHNTSNNTCSGHSHTHGNGHSSHGNGNGYGHNKCKEVCGYANADDNAIPGYTFLGRLGDKKYYLSDSKNHSWSEAEALASNYGGYLAVIGDQTENDFIENAIGNEKAWIGLSDHQTEGTYEWVNGDALSYTNWDKNEPKNYYSSYTGKYDYTVMYKNGEWRMKSFYHDYKYVMEVPCNNSKISVTQISGLASGSVFPVGVSTVTFVAIDSASGYTDTCSFNVTVEADTDAPVVDCKNITVVLSDGNYTLNPYDIDNGSYDNCSGIASITAVPSVFDASMVGYNEVTLVVVDSAGNVDSCSASVKVIDPNAVTYCSANGNTYYEWIHSVTIGGVQNTSGNDNGYGDYTANPIAVATGSVSIELTPGYRGKAYKEYWRIWIDYNHDGDFNDWGELVFQDDQKNTIHGNFNIPSWRSSGTYNMRIGMRYDSYGGPCGYCGYGEYEDYKITIGGNTARTKDGQSIAEVMNSDNEVDQREVTLYPNPTNGQFNLAFEGTFEEMISIEIRTLSGQLVKTEQLNGALIQNRVQLDINDQAKGVYFITIRQKDYVKVIKFSKM